MTRPAPARFMPDAQARADVRELAARKRPGEALSIDEIRFCREVARRCAARQGLPVQHQSRGIPVERASARGLERAG